MEKVCKNCIYAWFNRCIHGHHNSTAMTVFGACGHKKEKKPITKEQYNKLKPYFSDFVSEDPTTPKGIRFDPKDLNDGYETTDVEYLCGVVFQGTRNPWNAAQKLVAFMPYIIDRI